VFQDKNTNKIYENSAQARAVNLAYFDKTAKESEWIIKMPNML
jgi:hypothetical protein